MSSPSTENPARPYFVEGLGTFGLVLIAGGSVCVGQLASASASPWDALMVALATGVALAALLTWTVPISGGYLNPAITLALWVYKKLDGGKTTGLILAQLVGAVAAGGLLRIMFGAGDALPARLGTPHLNITGLGYNGITLWTLAHGIAAELCFSFILTIVIFATLIDDRTRPLDEESQRWGTLWVGVAMAAMVLVGFQLTGAAANPARWFGSAIWETTLETMSGRQPLADHMVYWIGPIVGALLGGGVYLRLVMGEFEEDHKHGHAKAKHGHS